MPFIWMTGAPTGGDDEDLRYHYKGAYQADGHIFHVWEDNGVYGYATIKSYTAPKDSPGYPATYDKRPDLDHELPNPAEAALHLASSEGNTNTVRYLLAAGANVNAPNQHDRTPLHLATAGDYADTVIALLDAGAYIEAKNEYGETALHQTVIMGKLDAVPVLVAAGAKLDSDDLSYGMAWRKAKTGKEIQLLDNTKLRNAAMLGDLAVVRKLLDAGADVNELDDYGYTPLHHAACYNNALTVTALLTAGARTDINDPNGKIALNHALDNQSVEALSALLVWAHEQKTS